MSGNIHLTGYSFVIVASLWLVNDLIELFIEVCMYVKLYLNTLASDNFLQIADFHEGRHTITKISRKV